MDVTVSLMDGRKFTLQVDAACTSGEVLREVAQKINLSDTYGFSLYISIMEKVILVDQKVDPLWVLGGLKDQKVDPLGPGWS